MAIQPPAVNLDDLQLVEPASGQLTDFRWNQERERAAYLLALGCTIAEVVEDDLIGVAQRTVYRWRDNPDFSLEVDRLTFLTSYATKAERIRFAKRMVRQRIVKDDDGNEFILSKKDVLDWLKFIKQELEPTEYRAFIFATFAPLLQQAIGNDPPGDIVNGVIVDEH